MKNDKLNIYYETFNKFTKVSKINYISFIPFMIEFCDILYNYIHNELEPIHLKDKNAEIEIREICQNINKEIYPKFKKIWEEYLLIKNKNEDMIKLFERIEDDLYSIMAMRSLKIFAYYIDRDKIPEDKVWENGTMVIFESYFLYANKMILTGKIDKIRASYFPGAGKSYAGNLTTAYWLGYNPNMTFLRITYNDDLTKSFVKQTFKILTSNRFKKVFPQFNLEEKELFTINNATSFQLKFSNSLNLVGTTCLGKGTGFRAKVLILDDVVKGVQDAYNVEMQSKIVNMYDNEWTSRADNGNQKIIALGTMWSCYDILNVIQKRALKNGVFQHPKYKYCLCDTDNLEEIKQVFISTPLLDYDTDESTCPERFSTEYARNKREDADDKDMFEAVYQQNPQEPEEMLFAYSRLKVYRTIPFNPKIDEYQTMAMIDPVREGQNYFAMPIYRRFKIKDSGKWSKWYFIDTIYKLQTNEFCQPFVVQKIAIHDIEWIGYEKNVDASYVKLIKQDLVKKSIKIPTIKMVYSLKNKDNKISMARNGIINDIIYPAQGMYSPKSEMGLFMIHLTTWQFMGRNKFDDAPDADAMFIIENPTNKKTKNTALKVIDRII